MDLTVRGLVTIDGSGAVAGGAVAAGGFDKVTEAQRRAAQAARDLQSGTAAAQAQMGKTQTQANGFAGVKLGSNDTQDLIKYGAALDSLRASYDPLFAASRKYEEMLQQLDVIERAQPALLSEVTAERERLRLSFENSVVSSGSATRAYNGTSGSLTNLSFQINDIASGIAMGQSPFQILAQQGGQVFQVWQMNNNVFKEAAGLLVKVATPANLAIATLVGVGVGLTAVYANSIAVGKELDSALLGTGRNAGVTASQLDDMAHRAAASSEIGIGAARSYAEAFASSGKVSGRSIGDLTGLVADYARLTRQDAGDASKELVSDFSDLSRGAGALDDKLGFLDDKTKQLILTLERQGDHNQAVAVTIDALKGSIEHSRDNLTWFERVWDDISNAAGKAADNISRAAPSNIDERIARARNMGGAPAGVQLLNPAYIPETNSLPELLQQQADKTSADLNDFLNRNAKKVSQDAGDIARALTPNYSQLQDLQAQQTKLGDSLTNPLSSSKMSPAIAQATALAYSAVTQNIKSLTDASGNLIPQIDVQNQQFAVARQAITAVGPAQKGYIAAEQERLSLIGQSISPGEAAARIENARALAIAQASHELDIQNRTTQIAIAGSIALADAYAKGGDGAMEAQARAQAMAESLTNGANVDARARQLLTQAVGGQAASMTQSQLQQERTNDATAKGNALVLSGALAYGRLSDYVQQNVELLQLEDLRKAAVVAGNVQLIAQIDAMIAKYPQLAQKRHEADAVSDIQNGLSSLSDNAPAAAQAARYALAIQQAGTWRSQTLDDIRDVGAAHDQLADDVETIFDDRMAQLYEDDLRRRRDWGAGIARANLDIVRSHQDMASKSESFLRGWDQDSEQLFVNFAKTGKFEIGDLVDFAVEQFTRLAYEKYLASSFNAVGNGILNLFSSALGASSGAGGGGGILDAGSAILSAGVAHTGWDTSAGGPPASRYVHAAYFDNAVRHHTGTGRIGANEKPVIVETSEKILTQKQSDLVEAALSQPKVFVMGQGSGGENAAPNIEINFNNQSGTPLQGRQGSTTRKADGGLSIEVIVSQVSSKMAENSSLGTDPFTHQLEQSHGLQRKPR